MATPSRLTRADWRSVWSAKPCSDQLRVKLALGRCGEAYQVAVQRTALPAMGASAGAAKAAPVPASAW
jgi:hypothetical protein